jgi:hypothetical protein
MIPTPYLIAQEVLDIENSVKIGLTVKFYGRVAVST